MFGAAVVMKMDERIIGVLMRERGIYERRIALSVFTLGFFCVWIGGGWRRMRSLWDVKVGVERLFVAFLCIFFFSHSLFLQRCIGFIGLS